MSIWQHHQTAKKCHFGRMVAKGVLFLGLLWPGSLALAAEQVTVTIPTFDVTLNGRTVDGTYSKYPLIVYKDITYFPMTYYDSRLLGVQADWRQEDGLTVTKQDGYFYEYMREINEQKNKRRLTAKIADGQITVNGKVIDNSKEDYPLLVCRDVTYFPLTWRFAAEEFGWDYDFTPEKGLVIANAGVTIESPEKWGEDSIRKFIGGAGSDYGSTQLVLPIMFKYPTEKTYSLSEALSIPEDIYNPLKAELNSYSLGLYNIHYGHDVIIHPMAQWEYQVCRLIGGRQEIIYWRKFSFFTGLLPQGHFASGGVWEEVPLWPSDVIKEGEYIFQLVPSGDISYEEVDTHLVKQISMEDCFLPEDAVGLYYSFVKVIITK